jgi:hypothetical protein
MPKGDKYKLKADPEDGTTPIANLLLEAVAMAKISGLQKGAILYLWRRTYGWTDENGKRKKEDKITLSEWAKALDSKAPRLSHCLSELAEKHIIIRRVSEDWGGYYYSLNTEISKWNSNSINFDKLKEVMGIVENATITQNATINKNAMSSEMDNSSDLDNSYLKQGQDITQNATVLLPKTQQCTLYKENNKEINKIDESLSSDNNLQELIHEKTDDEGNVIKEKKKKNKNPIDPMMGEKAKEVFAKLDSLRGYVIGNIRGGENKSVLRMLKTYSPEQIIKVWQSMKTEQFWQDKELNMMSVEKQIGAKLSMSKHNETNPDKFTQGSYGQRVKT